MDRRDGIVQCSCFALSDEQPEAPRGFSVRQRLRKSLERLLAVADELLVRLQSHFGGWGTLRAVCVVILPLAVAPWLLTELQKELHSPLFRDAAQCQYSGWCLLHGVRLYKDVGAPDGPLIHFLHALMQLFAGSSDRGCRVADLVIQIGVSGVMGAVLAPRSSETRLGGAMSRIAWGTLGAGLWLTWYFAQGWGQTVQRDAYFALLGYCGMVLVYASADFSDRGAKIAAAAGGVLCMVQVFGRHSGIAYPASALLAILFADDPTGERRWLRLRAALWGAAGAVVGILVLLVIFGSIRGLWFWYFEFPFTFYRFMAKQSAWSLFTGAYAYAGEIAVLVLVGVVVAVAVRAVPARAISFAFAPMLLLIAACIEGKGWANHVQQTTAAVVPMQLLVLSEIWGRRASPVPWNVVRSVAAVVVLVFITDKTGEAIHASGYMHMAMPQVVDPDIVEAKRVGDFVKAKTKPTDTVFLYGHESHVLLNAERRPAVPFYINMLLNIKVLYEHAPASPGQEPNAKQSQAIAKLEARINSDICHRLTTSPPGAMVFLDNSLRMFMNARAEVYELCPPVEEMLKAKYDETPIAGLDDYHVYLRKK
jgi:hypothetical protein